jgi:hypothetical protein
MSLVDKIKGAVFEDTAPKPVVKPVPPVTFTGLPPQPTPQNFVTGMVGGGQPVTDCSDQYQKMLANTDFDDTEVGKVLKQFSAPLQGVVMDEKQKFQAVLALARNSLGGVVTAKILGTFDELLNRLASMQTDFNAGAAAFERDEIVEKQKELTAATADLDSAQARLRFTVDGFAAALKTRTDELRQQRAHYESLMKG